MCKVHELINKEVKIGNREGEITKVLGCVLEVTFFNLNYGKTVIPIEEVNKYLV